MTRAPATELIRRAILRHGFDNASDVALLVRYTRQSDSDAFAELVHRYAGLVWGVCRRNCRDEHTAEDAFQATFIALARQAKSLRRPECLPGWLHGVARRTAWRLRRELQSSESGPAPDRPSATASPLEEASGRELLALVESEVARLPEKYRSAVIACWFEDDTLDEVAKRLGVSRGVLWGRLKRGRENLRRRLAARGVGLPAVIAAVALTGASASARLTERTIEASLRQTPAPVGLGVGTASLLKTAGGTGLAAALVIGLVTLLPGGGPEPKLPEKKSDKISDELVDDGFPLPTGALHRFGNRQMRHPEGIFASVVSPDGKLFATASYSAVVVWDLKTLSAKRTFADIHFNNYGSGSRGGRLAFLPDSTGLLISVRPSDTPGQVIRSPIDVAQVWDIDTGKLRHSMKAAWHYEPSAWLTANGKEIAVLGYQGDGGEIHFFETKDGKELRTVKIPHSFGTPWIAPGGEFLAYPGPNGDGFGIVEVKTGKELYSVTNTKVREAVVSRDGKLVIFVDEAGKVHGHDIGKQKELFAFDHPEKDKPGPMVISDDRQTLYYTSNHGRLLRWDLKANKKGPDIAGRHGFWSLTTISLSPDESTLYSTGLDHQIRRWELKTGKELPFPEGYRTITAMLPSTDGKHVIVGDHAGALDFWDVSRGRRVKQLPGAEQGGINCLAQSADGRWLAGGRTSQDIRLFDLSTGRTVRDIHLEKPEPVWSDHVVRVAFSPDGKVLFDSSARTGVTAWEVSSGKRLWNTAGQPTLMACDPKGRWIATGGGYGEPPIRWNLLEAKSGNVLGQGDVETAEVLEARGNYPYPPYLTDLVFMPDGSRLLTAHYDGTLRVWDPETRREIRRLKTHPLGGPACLAISPDGKWLAVGGWHRKVTIWELATGGKLQEFTGHHSWIAQVGFTRDGRAVVSNADLAPVLWDLVPKDLPAVDGLPYVTWDLLKSNEAAKAYNLQWALAKNPQAAIKLFDEYVKPAEMAIDREQLDKWVGALDNPQFRAREVAEKELTAAGYRIPLAWLRKALADGKSDELRARLQRVIARREKEPDPNELRLARLVQVLELAGSDDAKAMLKKWAEAGDGNPIGVEARAALDRIRK
jgi:RNA polymerase sigma factor (sigma-70 family)